MPVVTRRVLERKIVFAVAVRVSDGYKHGTVFVPSFVFLEASVFVCFFRFTAVAAVTTLTSVAMMIRESPQRKASKGNYRDTVYSFLSKSC